MTSDSCSAIPRSTLLSFALEQYDPPPQLSIIDDIAVVATHIRHCGHCRHLVDRMRDSRAVLRGRILGAARDRAWSELNRRLQALRAISRRLDPCDIPRRAVCNRSRPVDAADCWEKQRTAVGALASRLEGLGITVDLSDLPTRRPSTTSLPVVIRQLDNLLSIVGGAGAGHDPAEDYQPSAAPSFLDSLPPR